MIYNINKPIGWTSFDVVKKIRNITKLKKVGHGGTLDPFADGVLIIGVGKGTKLLTDIVNEKKSYNATLFLGEETDSLDSEGEIVKRKSVPKLNEDLVIKILNSFLGRYIQKPPMFSAKKVNGVRLYRLARKKIEVERDDQNCTIYDISLKGIESNVIEFAVTCSKGTYIRVLGSDIAKKIGTVGYLTKLTRTSIGKHSLSKSLTIKNFESKWKSTEN
ncbi:MAG: tRNA pseudouridine(55) synthase TruB [Candidatus Neomarinimicrobiota bacterium]|nr:tRNA pseudouridine(55) synthase TruB [Candidatus Neomarinimicrobiota bacterium]